MIGNHRISAWLFGLSIGALCFIAGCGRGFDGFVGDFLLMESDTIVVAEFDGDILRSEDGGATWRQVESLPGAISEPPTAAILQLVEGSEGTIWARQWGPRPLHVSQDGGTTFATVPFGDDDVYTQYVFIPRAGDDPLLLELNGQLWIPEGMDAPRATGVRNGDGIGQLGALCGDIVFVLATSFQDGSADSRTTLWRSQDLGLSWEMISQFEDIEFADMACHGPAGLVLLPLFGPDVFEFNIETGDRSNLAAADQDFAYLTAIQSDSGQLWIGGLGEESSEGLVVRQSADGDRSRFPMVGSSFPNRIKVDSRGTVWVVGDGLHRLDPGGARFVQVWP